MKGLPYFPYFQLRESQEQPKPPEPDWCNRCWLFQYPGDGTFCGQCGDPLVEWPKCQCGHGVTTYKFCTHCGKEYAR